ncbi:MAG: monomethylamine:corrinoid methyltransferase [Planctomycetota bacterium]|jgi:methylamine--corrinoid protein Co-methyltransferase
MIGFLEVLERATTGPMMSAKEYDMKVFIPAVRRVVKKFKIEFDRKDPCPSDDDLVDRIYQAGLELYAEVGTYCTDTERVIHFTKEEIEQAVYECPKVVYFGEGPDRVQWHGRMPDDNKLPHCHVGSGENGRGIWSDNQGKNNKYPVTYYRRHTKRLIGVAHGSTGRH